MLNLSTLIIAIGVILSFIAVSILFISIVSDSDIFDNYNPIPIFAIGLIMILIGCSVMLIKEIEIDKETTYYEFVTSDNETHTGPSCNWRNNIIICEDYNGTTYTQIKEYKKLEKEKQ